MSLYLAFTVMPIGGVATVDVHLYDSTLTRHIGSRTVLAPSEIIFELSTEVTNALPLVMVIRNRNTGEITSQAVTNFKDRPEIEAKVFHHYIGDDLLNIDYTLPASAALQSITYSQAGLILAMQGNDTVAGSFTGTAPSNTLVTLNVLDSKGRSQKWYLLLIYKDTVNPDGSSFYTLQSPQTHLSISIPGILIGLEPGSQVTTTDQTLGDQGHYSSNLTNIEYTNTQGYVGLLEFPISITDPSGGVSTHTITIEVLPELITAVDIVLEYNINTPSRVVDLSQYISATDFELVFPLTDTVGFSWFTLDQFDDKLINVDNPTGETGAGSARYTITNGHSTDTALITVTYSQELVPPTDSLTITVPDLAWYYPINLLGTFSGSGLSYAPTGYPRVQGAYSLYLQNGVLKVIANPHAVVDGGSETFYIPVRDSNGDVANGTLTLVAENRSITVSPNTLELGDTQSITVNNLWGGASLTLAHISAGEPAEYSRYFTYVEAREGVVTGSNTFTISTNLAQTQYIVLGITGDHIEGMISIPISAGVDLNATDDSTAYLSYGQTVFANVLQNDNYPPNLAPNSLQIISPPLRGTAEVTSDNTIKYVSSRDYLTDASLTYKIVHNGQQSNPATLSIANLGDPETVYYISEDVVVPYGGTVTVCTMPLEKSTIGDRFAERVAGDSDIVIASPTTLSYTAPPGVTSKGSTVARFRLNNNTNYTTKTLDLTVNIIISDENADKTLVKSVELPIVAVNISYTELLAGSITGTTVVPLNTDLGADGIVETLPAYNTVGWRNTGEKVGVITFEVSLKDPLNRLSTVTVEITSTVVGVVANNVTVTRPVGYTEFGSIVNHVDMDATGHNVVGMFLTNLSGTLQLAIDPTYSTRINITPQNTAGSGTATYRVRDGEGNEDTATVSVTITQALVPPSNVTPYYIHKLSHQKVLNILDSYLGEGLHYEEVAYAVPYPITRNSITAEFLDGNFVVTSNPNVPATPTDFQVTVRDVEGNEHTSWITVTTVESSAYPDPYYVTQGIPVDIAFNDLGGATIREVALARYNPTASGRGLSYTISPTGSVAMVNDTQIRLTPSLSNTSHFIVLQLEGPGIAGTFASGVVVRPPFRLQPGKYKTVAYGQVLYANVIRSGYVNLPDGATANMSITSPPTYGTATVGFNNVIKYTASRTQSRVTDELTFQVEYNGVTAEQVLTILCIWSEHTGRVGHPARYVGVKQAVSPGQKITVCDMPTDMVTLGYEFTGDVSDTSSQYSTDQYHGDQFVLETPTRITYTRDMGGGTVGHSGHNSNVYWCKAMYGLTKNGVPVQNEMYISILLDLS